MVLGWIAAVDTDQSVDKSLDQNCVAKMEPSKVAFVSSFEKSFLPNYDWYWGFLISVSSVCFLKNLLKT